MDFNKFKEQRKTMSESLSKMREEKETGGFKPDETVYFPGLDTNGNGYAIVRILPQKDASKHPVQKIWKHKNKVNGRNISILCPSTFGTMKDCELCQEASSEWKARSDAGEEKPQVAAYRKATKLCNVLVVKDSFKPDCEGKVFKMYLPFQIEDKINDKLFPPKTEDGTLIYEPEMIHDLWEGKNLIVSIKKNKMGYSDYSNSQFSPEKTPVAKTDKEIEEIYNQLFELEPSKDMLLTNEEIIEKWNTFHSLNHSETLDDQKEKREAEAKKRAEEKKNEKAAEKEAEESFSMPATEESNKEGFEDMSSSDSDDDMPWD